MKHVSKGLVCAAFQNRHHNQSHRHAGCLLRGHVCRTSPLTPEKHASRQGILNASFHNHLLAQQHHHHQQQQQQQQQQQPDLVDQSTHQNLYQHHHNPHYLPIAGKSDHNVRDLDSFKVIEYSVMEYPGHDGLAGERQTSGVAWRGVAWRGE
ncbi:hypothetical protein E2C01_056323 [Portunus trituberculatus]|uniref:Uncharacterized protein n=1 Tax=Portunus trituberculatus TaxID=210409 RepID=A0A5B7GQ43_PORTR|nr:hypothetical protein [Portunus trituberculatus]